MINTLLEHVPIKLEAPENGDDTDNKHKRNVNGKGAQAVNAGADELDDDDDDSEEESETDVLEDDETTMVAISSDEEAELEAQRIKLQDLIANSLLQRGSGGKQVRTRSASSSTNVSTSSSVIAVEQNTSKQKQQKKVTKQQQNQQKSKNGTTSSTEVATTTTGIVPETAVAIRRGRTRTSSICSVASSLVTPSCQTESCGNIYQINEMQIYLFNCSFCEELCSDMSSFSQHLHVAHKLFHEDEEEIPLTKAAEATPQRRSTRNQVKQAAHASTTELPVKLEPRAVGTEQDSPPIKLPIVGHKGRMQSCGNIFVLNHKKLFLICGYCECKYANLELFDKHLRQQHEIFGSPRKEIDVLPKAEVKKEVFIITEIESSQTGASVVEVVTTRATVSTPVVEVPAQAMVAIPESMQLNNNDMLTTVLPSQAPDTPPPDEEKLDSEKVVEQQVVVEAAGAETSSDMEQDLVRLAEEATPVEESQTEPPKIPELTQKQKRVTKRKLKRKTFSRCRSPPKRHSVKAKKPIVEEPVLAVVAPKRRRGRPAAAPSNRRTKPSTLELPHQPPSPRELTQSTKLVPLPEKTVHPSTEPDSSAVSVVDSELASYKSTSVQAPPQLHHCDLCHKSFKKSSRLAEHRRLHTGEKPFRCEECGRQFRIKMRLNEHKLRHRKEKAFKCEICGLCVSTKQDLVLHQRHHSGDRRYRCPECPKAFVRGSDLKIHVRVHTGEKPFVCEICQKSFRANQNLIVHRRSHLGEKNYKCDFCEKRFMRNIDRKVHHRTHTGEKPYKCEICQRGYSSRVHVRAHIEREHVKSADGMKPGRKKPGPKPRAYKEELAKQQQMIEELQQQLLQQIMAEDMADDEELVMEAKVEKQSTSQLQQASVSTTAARVSSTQKVEEIEPSQKHGSMQQVSVTVSMQMQEDLVEAIAPMPEKENDTSLASPALNQNVKKERKITSYFTVVGQKTEI